MHVHIANLEHEKKQQHVTFLMINEPRSLRQIQA